MEFATSCRRLANVDDLRNLRYDSGAITRGRHARRLRYKIMSARMDLIKFSHAVALHGYSIILEISLLLQTKVTRNCYHPMRS